MEKIFIPDELNLDEKLTDTEQITQIIGANLKRARHERGFSLDEVSLRSSVSKSMLSDIERGRKCPTVAVLYKICEGIHISLPSLLKVPEKIVEVVKSQPMINCGEFEVQYLFRYDIHSSSESHKMKFAPKTEFHADSHGLGVWEYIFVIDGVFTLIIDDEVYEITNGEALRFLANRKHIYANRTDRDLWVYNMIYYGS